MLSVFNSKWFVRAASLTALLFLMIHPVGLQAQTPLAPDNNVLVERSAPPAASAPDLMLGPGDLIELKVYGVGDLSETLRIATNGDIDLPLIGAVKVGGLTVDQAQKAVEQRLVSGGFINEPHVSILVREFTTQGVAVLGEVQHPGHFPILSARHLMDAISAAGGFSMRAGKTIIVTHRDNSAAQTITWSFDPVKLQQANIELHGGDSVTVGKAGIVYVTGEVAKPGGFVLDQSDSVTVLQALALAQGAKPTASLNKARLIRKSPQGPQEIDVALKDITSTKKPDLAMQADDILFIPNSAGKSAGRRSLESIIQITTGVLIYRP